MTTASAEVVDLGRFTVGEVPAPLTYQFLDDDGVALNTTSGWASDDASFVYRRSRTTTETTRSAVLTTASATATYTWVAADFATAGVYRGRFQIDNGTNVYKSVTLVWEVQSVT